MLLGSAQTRSSLPASDLAAAFAESKQAAARRPVRLMRLRIVLVRGRRRCGLILLRCRIAEPENEQLASAGRIKWKILCRAAKSQRRVSHTRINFRVCDDARPASDTGQNRNVLLSIRSSISHRLADKARSGPELPKDVAIGSVNNFKEAVHRAVECDVSGGDERAAPDRQI